MRPVIPILAALLSAPFTSVIAQEQPPPLEKGQRVRVSSPAAFGDDRQVAMFEALRGDTLIVTVDSLTHLLPFGVVTRLEVSRGQKSNVLKGAVGGAMLAGALALVAAVATEPLASEGRSDVLSITMYVAAGAGIGALVGALKTSDRWQEVPLDQLRVSVVQQHDGRFGLGLSVRF